MIHPQLFGLIFMRLDKLIKALKKCIQFLSLKFQHARRKIAAIIEPQKQEPSIDWDFPIDTSLRCAKALRDQLSLDEQTYLFVAGQALSDSRQYILYTALDEAKKTALYLMRVREFLSGPTVSPREHRIARLLTTQVLEEERARERRLIEVLVSLVLFESTNEQLYYRHLLLLEDLEDHLSANYDFQEFYGGESANFDHSAEHAFNEIQTIEQEIDFERAWYLRYPKKLPELAKLRPGQILSSVRARVKKALPLMTDSEKFIIRYSYGAGYGSASESIHYSVNPQDYKLSQGDEMVGIKGLGLLNFCILERCHRILGRPDVPSMTQLSRILELSRPTEHVYSQTVRDINLGDFVLAYGDLGEVMEIAETEYGYRSYRVSYLAEKPIPEIQEDWFPAFWVQRFYTKSQAREEFQKMIDKGLLSNEIAERMNKLSDDELQPYIRDALVHTWKSGLRDWVKNKRKETKKSAKINK
jgi:hypothetical protein